MKKSVIIWSCVLVLLSSCAAEFNRVYKTTNYDYKYEYAKQMFAEGQFAKATTLLEELVLHQYILKLNS